MIEVCFKRVFSVFQRYLNFQGSFLGVSRRIEWFSERPLKEIQGRFKGLKGCFKEVSRQFQRHLKKVSRVYKERVRLFQENFTKSCCMDLIAATRAEGGLVCIGV